MKARWYAVAACTVALLTSGCAVNARIRDTSNAEVNLTSVRITPAKTVTVMQGNALRTIKLRNIQKMYVYPQSSVSAQGRVYFQTRMVMKNGAKIGYSDTKDKQPRNAYIDVLNYGISAKNNNGDYRIPLEKVAEIEVVRRHK